MDDESGESMEPMEETYFVWRLDVEKNEANFSPVFRAGSSHRPSMHGLRHRVLSGPC